MKSDIFFESDAGKTASVGFCEKNLNILAHAQSIELDIGSLCGGHGVCGGDRVQIEPGVDLSPITEFEKKHLSPEEFRAGWRLACQCFPENSTYTIRVKYKNHLK